MVFRWSFIIFVIVMFTFNITEFECSKKINGTKKISGKQKLSGTKNKTFMYPAALMTEYPLGISDVFDDASNVFRKILGKMVANKKLVGLDSGWYW